MNKAKILKGYENVIEEQIGDGEPLCLFLEFYYPDLLSKFKNYLVNEGILRSDRASIYFKYFHSRDDDESDTIHLANCFRYLVLEDFLNKHL